jgi:hypothetical protein
MDVCIRGGPQESALAPRPLKIYCALLNGQEFRWESNINAVVKKKYSDFGEFKKLNFMICISHSLRLTISLGTKKSENYCILHYRVRKILTLDKLREYTDNDQLSPVLVIVSQ